MTRVALPVAVIAGVVGLVLGWLVFSPAEAPAPVAAEPPGAAAATSGGAGDAQVERLRQELDRERRRRQTLESEIAALRQGAVPPGTAPDEASASDPVSEPAAEDAEREEWVDAGVLARGGFPPDDVDTVRQFYEALALERLYLRDRATREGWIAEPRYRRAQRALQVREARIREEWGDDAYDWILHAADKPNRAVVKHVMEGSQAEAVGLQEGDVFIRYDDERIFGVAGLRRVTTEGRLGETAAIEIERGGLRLRFFPERGPLGIVLDTESRQPSEPAF